MRGIKLLFFGIICVASLTMVSTHSASQVDSNPSCATVVDYSYPGTFRRHSNLRGLLAELMGLSQSSTEMRRQLSSSDLIEHLKTSSNWIELGPMYSNRVLETAFARIAEGDIVVAFSDAANGRPAQTALIIGSKTYPSSLWKSGVPAGVYYHPTNSNRSFAGCKLSYVWRSPATVQLFVFSPNQGEPGSTQPSYASITEVQTGSTSAAPITPPSPYPKPPVFDLLSPDRFEGDPVYTADKTLSSFKDRTSQATDQVSFNRCVFLHGPKGWVSEWNNLREADRVDLAEFLTKVPTTKLQVPGGETDEDAQFIIGPICSCSEYGKTQKNVSRYNFDLHGILREDDHKLTACLGKARD